MKYYICYIFLNLIEIRPPLSIAIDYLDGCISGREYFPLPVAPAMIKLEFTLNGVKPLMDHQSIIELWMYLITHTYRYHDSSYRYMKRSTKHKIHKDNFLMMKHVYNVFNSFPAPKPETVITSSSGKRGNTFTFISKKI